MALPIITPNEDRALSADERNRMHTALLDVEHAIDALPGGAFRLWTRVFVAQVSSSRTLPGATCVNLLPPVTSQKEAMTWRLLVRRWWRDRHRDS
jgi:hypothetical protein